MKTIKEIIIGSFTEENFLKKWIYRFIIILSIETITIVTLTAIYVFK